MTNFMISPDIRFQLKIFKIQRLKKIAVILKFEQIGFTIELCTPKMQTE